MLLRTLVMLIMLYQLYLIIVLYSEVRMVKANFVGMRLGNWVAMLQGGTPSRNHEVRVRQEADLLGVMPVNFKRK